MILHLRIIYKNISKTVTRVIFLVSMVFPFSFFIAGCTSLNNNGELVRHHVGYIQIVTPAKVAGDKPLQMLEVETLGMWFDIDQRKTPERTGSGGGIGYRFDRRELVPLSCRVVFRVKDKEQIKFLVELLKKSGEGDKGICAIRDSQ